MDEIEKCIIGNICGLNQSWLSPKPPKFTETLQEIDTHIPTGQTPPLTTAGVSELKMVGNNNRNTSAPPTKEENLSDGTLYTGSYLYKQWVSSSVTTHHNKILAIRKVGRGEQKSNDYKKGRQQKRKLAKLRPQISELESTKQRLISKLATTPRLCKKLTLTFQLGKHHR